MIKTKLILKALLIAAAMGAVFGGLLVASITWFPV